MKIAIFTQAEGEYLPSSFASVCEALHERLTCIIMAPAMSTHGGALKGLIRHAGVFGLVGTFGFAIRVARNKIANLIYPEGRNGRFYSIEAVARAYRIPLYHVKRVGSDATHEIIDRHAPELLISISCPQIIGKKLRARFPLGCINVHGAPLPKYRGLMPAFWALLNGEETTAVTVHDLADKLDNGEILMQTPVEISPEDTWDSLVRKTKTAGATALIEAVRAIEAGTIARTPNLDEEATYFSFPTPVDAAKFRAAGRRFF